MFENCTEQLDDNIFVYRNFISQEECDNIVNYLDSLDESQWQSEPNRKDGLRLAFNVDLLLPVRAKIESLLDDQHVLGKGYSATRMLPGDFWGVHADVHDLEHILEASNKYIDGMAYEEKELSVFGTVVYFNELEGGEIFYPRQNIVHKQKPGDLVVHSAGYETEHGVQTVISGKRYAYSNSIRKVVKIPTVLN